MKTKQKTYSHAATQMGDTNLSVRTTSGYVPIVGTPTDPTVPAPGDGTSTTEFTISALEPISAASSTNGDKQKARSFAVTITGIQQQWLDAATGWTNISSADPNPPFSLDITVSSVPINVGKDEQFVVTVTNLPNYTSNDVRVIVDYTVGSGADAVDGQVIVQRAAFSA